MSLYSILLEVMLMYINRDISKTISDARKMAKVILIYGP